jgi:hypothetical protein
VAGRDLVPGDVVLLAAGDLPHAEYRIQGLIVRCYRASRLRRGPGFVDSPLEEAGFELTVPPERKAFSRALDRFTGPR